MVTHPIELYGKNFNFPIYGKNFDFPSVLTNNLLAINEEVSSKTVCNYLQSLHVAKKALHNADNSNRIKKALKHCSKIK